MISGDDIPNEQDVDREIHRIVRYLSRLPYTSNGFPNGSRLTEIALKKLHSQGYVQLVQDHDFEYKLTPSGWEYSEQVELGAVLYWATKNWFAVVVAASAFIASVLAILLD